MGGFFKLVEAETLVKDKHHESSQTCKLCVVNTRRILRHRKLWDCINWLIISAGCISMCIELRTFSHIYIITSPCHGLVVYLCLYIFGINLGVLVFCGRDCNYWYHYTPLNVTFAQNVHKEFEPLRRLSPMAHYWTHSKPPKSWTSSIQTSLFPIHIGAPNFEEVPSTIWAINKIKK